MSAPKTVCMAAIFAVAMWNTASGQTQQRAAGGDLAKWFKQWDQNGDGKITKEEAAKAPWLDQRFDRLDRNMDGILTREEFGLLPLAAPSAQSPAMRTSPPGMKREFTFIRDYTPGTKDANGKMRAGQELMRIVAYKRELFASTSLFTDPRLYIWGDPDYPGCQVLRKPNSRSEWLVDVSFGRRYLRTDTLQVIRFTKDAHDKNLSNPVEMLVVGIYDLGAAASLKGRHITLAVRDDATGKWALIPGPSVPDADKEMAAVRAIWVYTDKVTGKEYLFVGAHGGGIHKCVYDPQAPGSIRWLTGNEIDESYGRAHSFCEANGSLYVSLDYGEPWLRLQNGGVFLRHDGDKPTWECVYRNRDPKHVGWNQTARGITAVPAEDGSGKEVILVAVEGPPEPIIVRIEPHNNHQAVTELNYYNYMRDVVFKRNFPAIAGTARNPTGGAYIAAPNYFDPFIDPETKKANHIAGLLLAHPDNPNAGCNGAYFLIRRAPGVFDWGEIPSGLVSGESLRGVRTVCKSPFKDEPNVYCFGGFVTNPDVQPPRPNLCWIYKGVVGKRVEGSVHTSPKTEVSYARFEDTSFGFSFNYPADMVVIDNTKVLLLAATAGNRAPTLLADVVTASTAKDAVTKAISKVFGDQDLKGYAETYLYLGKSEGVATNLKPGGKVGKRYTFDYSPGKGEPVRSAVGMAWTRGDKTMVIVVSYWGDFNQAMANVLLNSLLAHYERGKLVALQID